jgi:hypothetical protein
MIDFPDAPVLNDEFVVGDKTFVFNGEVWAFKAFTNLSSQYVLKTGDVMTGPLSLPVTIPNDPSSATTKDYVDTMPIDGGSFSSPRKRNQTQHLGRSK